MPSSTCGDSCSLAIVRAKVAVLNSKAVLLGVGGCLTTTVDKQIQGT
jgi:hypothetical protein